MAKGIYAALSGAVAANVQLDITAQNLSNSTSGGYQRLRPLFREVMANAERGGRPAPSANHYGAAQGTVIDLTPGVTRTTGRPLDVALPTETFLAVRAPAGERYTRAGSIAISPDGTLRVGNAPLVDETGEPIKVDSTLEIRATSDGQIVADGETVARLKLVRFEQPSRLTPESGSLYAANQDSGAAQIADGELGVGALEESNASPVNAMTELLSATRHFDAVQRAIDTFRDADRKIVTVPQS